VEIKRSTTSNPENSKQVAFQPVRKEISLRDRDRHAVQDDQNGVKNYNGINSLFLWDWK
jgi:hypothetical protein